MELVKTGSVDAILVTKMDRLGRSLLHLLEVLGQLNESDVQLITVDEPSDWSTGAGRLSMQILGSIAEFERSRIQERVHSGLLTRVRNGGFVGSRAPFGYRAIADPTGKGLILEVDPEGARWVCTAFELLIQDGVSNAETARRMDRQGMRSPGGGRLTTSSLREWAVGSGPRTCGGIWSWGAATAAIPAILSDTEAEQWAEWAVSRPRSAPTSHGTYLLSGLVATPCGRKYSGRTCTGQTPTYVCRNRMSLRPSDPERCQCRSIGVDHLDSVVWDRFTEIVLSHASAVWRDAGTALGVVSRDVGDSGGAASLGLMLGVDG